MKKGEKIIITLFHFYQTNPSPLISFLPVPYSSKNLIDDDCVSCKEPADADENTNGDNDDARE